MPRTRDYAPPPPSKILLALTPDKVERLARVLEGHELHFARSRAEAMEMLQKDGYAMVIVGVHFDESQMFPLLADIRTHANYRKVPILCVLGERGRALTQVAVEGLDHAVKAMTANGFLDLLNFPDDEAGNARIRRIVDYLILIDGDLQALTQAQGQEVVDMEERRRTSLRS
jgi:PleD family two-component response regulator